MSGSVTEVLLAVSVPVAVTALAAVAATVRPAGPRLLSALQHFAGGLIFAAVAVELLPEIHDAEPLAVVLGSAVGLAAMLGLRAWTSRLEGAGGTGGRTLVATVGMDLLIDGLLLGIAFSIGSSEGVLLTVGLTAELLALGLTVSGRLRGGGASRAASVLTTTGLTLALVAGAVIGVSALGGLSGPAFAALVGLGSVALLYLVVEELLAEAHTVRDTPAVTASFFAGFLLLLVL